MKRDQILNNKRKRKKDINQLKIVDFFNNNKKKKRKIIKNNKIKNEIIDLTDDNIDINKEKKSNIPWPISYKKEIVKNSLITNNSSIAHNIKRKQIKNIKIIKRSEKRNIYEQINIETLQEETPLLFIQNFLPSTLADRLFQELIPEDDIDESLINNINNNENYNEKNINDNNINNNNLNWKNKKWWLFDKSYDTPRMSQTYRFTDIFSNIPNILKKYNKKIFIDINSSDELLSAGKADIAPPLFHHVKTLIIKFMSNYFYKKRINYLNNSNKIENDIYQYIPNNGWIPNFVFCNLYRNENDCVGTHSDRLTVLGPKPYIVSLTLGCRRKFRLIKYDNLKHIDLVYEIELPHNSLLVMLPLSQEEWKHEVPRIKDYIKYSGPRYKNGIKKNNEYFISKSRINLTFRHLRIQYALTCPKCNCNRRSILRYINKKGKNQGKYFYICNNIGGTKTCNFFQFAKF